ncbi:small-subunit processome [Paraphysoderma sedebokerense]|nr:small-subunit processome [Paraphysoderma sedebokerense]
MAPRKLSKRASKGSNNASQSQKSVKKRTPSAKKLNKKILNVFSVKEDESSDDDPDRYDSVENYEYKLNEIDPEDDEEIDEEMAFNSEDEELFSSYKFYSGNKNEAVERTKDEEKIENFDLDSLPDEQQSEVEDDDMIDLSEMLMSGTSVDKIQSKASKLPNRPMEEESFSAEEEESYDEPAFSSDDDEEMSNEESRTSLDKVIDTFATKGQQANKKRKKLEETNEAYDESEFNLPLRQGLNKKKKLDLFDLIDVAGGNSSSDQLKKQVQSLKKDTEESKVLDAPLPKRIQDRLNRTVAYDQSKEELDKWQAIVKKNREAENLSFPIAHTGRGHDSNASFVSQFSPETSLEQEIENLLQSTGMKDEKKLQEQEELAMNQLSVEEVEERRKELRLMRELAFREELKLKRMSKIKSKAYRKILKKEKERQKAQSELSLEELKELDPELAREEQLKIELERAKERVTLRHKNTGKWAKFMLGRGKNADEGTRQAIIEQLAKHESLTKKIEGIESGSSDDEDVDDVGDDTVQSTKRELAQVEKSFQNDQMEMPTKGVFAMKFMQRAMTAEREQAKVMLEEMKMQLETDNLGEDTMSDERDSAVAAPSLIQKKSGNAGRLVVGRTTLRSDEFEQDDNDISGVVGEQLHQVSLSAAHTTELSGPLSIDISSEKLSVATSGRMDSAQSHSLNEQKVNVKSMAKPKSTNRSTANVTFEVENPWGPESSQLPSSSGSNTALDVQNQSNSLNTNFAVEEGDTSPSGDEDASFGDANPWISESADVVKPKSAAYTMDIKSTRGHKMAEKSLSKLKQSINRIHQEEASVEKIDDVTDTVRADNGHSDDDSSDSDKDAGYDMKPISDSTNAKSSAKNSKALSINASQQDLVKAAFANDDVIEEFEDEKNQIMEEDKPKDIDLTLPGWGSWAGSGVKKTTTKKIIKKAKPGDGVEVNKRKDAKLKHVIINEKRVKKVSKYLVPDVPHPFENRQQYELAIAQPVGKEWNTASIYQKHIKPKVSTKLGAIIEPVKFVKQVSKDGDSDIKSGKTSESGKKRRNFEKNA